MAHHELGAGSVHQREQPVDWELDPHIDDLQQGLLLAWGPWWVLLLKVLGHIVRVSPAQGRTSTAMTSNSI